MKTSQPKSENIISHPTSLPKKDREFYHGFFHLEQDFYYYQLMNPIMPILKLHKWVRYNLRDNNFEKIEEGLVQCKEIEDFINTIDDG